MGARCGCIMRCAGCLRTVISLDLSTEVQQSHLSLTMCGLHQDTISAIVCRMTVRGQDVCIPLPLMLDGISVCMLVTNDVSRDTRVRREARALMDAGATVTIVGMGELGVRDDEYDVRLIAPPRVSNAPIRIQRVLANVSASFRFQRLMLDTAREVGADVYHCNDLDTLWAGSRAARHRDAAVVYDSHELYLEDAGVTADWRYPLLARIERQECPRADIVITVNEAIAEELARRYRVEPLVIFNGPDRCAGASPAGVPLRVLFQGSYSEGRALQS